MCKFAIYCNMNTQPICEIGFAKVSAWNFLSINKNPAWADPDHFWVKHCFRCATRYSARWTVRTEENNIIPTISTERGVVYVVIHPSHYTLADFMLNKPESCNRAKLKCFSTSWSYFREQVDSENTCSLCHLRHIHKMTFQNNFSHRTVSKRDRAGLQKKRCCFISTLPLVSFLRTTLYLNLEIYKPSKY